MPRWELLAQNLTRKLPMESCPCTHSSNTAAQSGRKSKWVRPAPCMPINMSVLCVILSWSKNPSSLQHGTTWERNKGWARSRPTVTVFVHVCHSLHLCLQDNFKCTPVFNNLIHSFGNTFFSTNFLFFKGTLIKKSLHMISTSLQK